MGLPDPQELKRKDEIDRLITRANYHRMRQEFDRVEEVCAQILELDQNHPLAREWTIDALHERGKLEEAAAGYKKLMEEDPSNASAETKYAKVTLEMAELEREKELAREMLENPQKFVRPDRSPVTAMILSIVLPGLGHLYLRETIKSGILIGSFVICCAVLAFSPGTGELIRQLTMILAMGYGDQVDGAKQPIGVASALFAAFLAFTYIYAIIDAPIIATKSELARRKEKEGQV